MNSYVIQRYYLLTKGVTNIFLSIQFYWKQEPLVARQPCCPKLKKAVTIHNIIEAHELHLCAKTILNENYRCVSTNLHSLHAKCFKIKAKKP